MDKATLTPVDLAVDAENGLYLCLCDINPSNFKKFEGGTVVALDFRAICFLPPVFFVVAMVKLREIVPRNVAGSVQCPTSSDVNAIVSASYFLVPFGSNNTGQSDRFSFYIR